MKITVGDDIAVFPYLAAAVRLSLRRAPRPATGWRPTGPSGAGERRVLYPLRINRTNAGTKETPVLHRASSLRPSEPETRLCPCPAINRLVPVLACIGQANINPVGQFCGQPCVNHRRVNRQRHPRNIHIAITGLPEHFMRGWCGQAKSMPVRERSMGNQSKFPHMEQGRGFDTEG